MTVGQKIKYQRERLQLSQVELAWKLRSKQGTPPHPQAVSNWERDVSEPNGRFIAQIAELSGVPVSWFYDKDGVAA